MSFIEVCSGCGGLSTGLVKAGFQPLLLNDLDKNCCETLRLNHPGVNVVRASLEKLDLTEYRDRVDLLAGGIPCQSFSFAGKQKGIDDPRGRLFQDFAKLVAQCEPKVFLIENVKGLLSHNKGETLQLILNHLDPEKKYDICYKLLNAKHFRVAQHRERLFIVGIRQQNSGKVFTFPEPVGESLHLKDVLCDVPESEGYLYNEKKAGYFERIPQGGCWIDLPVDLQKEYMGKSYNSPGGKRGILKRLSMEDVSLTLLCSPSQKQTERCHPLETRPLSIREYARIQGFEDSYKFHGSIASQYKQIGNAVPINLAYHVGKSIYTFLSKTEDNVEIRKQKKWKGSIRTSPGTGH